MDKANTDGGRSGTIMTETSREKSLADAIDTVKGKLKTSLEKKPKLEDEVERAGLNLEWNLNPIQSDYSKLQEFKRRMNLIETEIGREREELISYFLESNVETSQKLETSSGHLERLTRLLWYSTIGLLAATSVLVILSAVDIWLRITGHP